MNNFIVQHAANSIKTVGYTPTCGICNAVKKIFVAENNFLIFHPGLKGQVNKLAACLCKALAGILIWGMMIPCVNAQQDLNYAVHANIIYRFTKYIDWPADYNSGDFVIGIVGDTPLYEELDRFIANKTVANRKIVIRKMSSGADFYNCHILFICEDKSKSLLRIAAATKGRPTLIVSENSSGTSRGSCINFVIVNDHLKLEINKANIEDRNLNIASELLRLGTIIK
ncbi:MAG: YfiR family protein [Ferruginibacter sp.]|nr:YfiR family protein [Ferruginibacter sp.]